MIWNHKQRELIAEFLANFALAWISFALIAPFFSPIENVGLFVIRLIISIGIVKILLEIAFNYLK